MVQHISQTDNNIDLAQQNRNPQNIEVTQLPHYKELETINKDYKMFRHLFDLNWNRFESSNTIKGPRTKYGNHAWMKTFEEEEGEHIHPEPDGLEAREKL